MDIGNQDLVELCRLCFRSIDLNERSLDIPPSHRDTSGTARTEAGEVGRSSRSRGRRGRRGVRGRRRGLPEPDSEPTHHDSPYIPEVPAPDPDEV